MIASSNPILLIHVFNCLTQCYHLNWVFYNQRQIDHLLLVSYHLQFYAWKKHDVAFYFGQNFQANRMTMANSSKWQLIWPFT